MKKILLFLLFAVCTSTFCSAQLTFKKTFGENLNDDAFAITETYDGGFVMVGDTYSFGAGKSDMYIVKFDSVGNKVWDETVGSSDYDHAKAIIQTNDSGFAVVGVIGSNTNYMSFLKLSKDGTKQWFKYFSANKRNSANTIVQSYDGGYLLGGQLSTNDNGSWGYLIKTDKNGDLQWSKKVFDLSFYPEIRQIVKTKDSGYALLANNPVTLNDIALIKVDSTGNFQWAKSIGGASNDLPAWLIKTNDEGFVIAGSTFSFTTSWEMFAIRTDSSGNLRWSRNIGTGPGTGFLKSQFASSVIETKDKGFLFAGTTDSSTNGKTSPYFVKLDSLGKLQWTKVLSVPNPILAYGGIKILKTKDGGFAAGGSMYSGRSDDFLLMKFDSSMNICGDSSSEGTASKNGEMIPLTINIINANTTQFVGPYSVVIQSGSEATICEEILPVKLLFFTAEKSITGNILSWATSEEINSDHFDIERSNNGSNFSVLSKVNAAGNSSNVQHYSFTDVKPFTGTNYYRLKMIDKDGRFNYSETRILAGSNTAIRIYPNPVKNNLTLEISSTTSSAAYIKIINLQGKVLRDFPLQIANGLNKQTIPVNNLQAGVYMLQINTGDVLQMIKFVKQ